jgi:hypothetical protein
LCGLISILAEVIKLNLLEIIPINWIFLKINYLKLLEVIHYPTTHHPDPPESSMGYCEKGRLGWKFWYINPYL